LMRVAAVAAVAAASAMLHLYTLTL
jgi:hypothetical protein